MALLLAAARKDLKRRLADLPALALWLGIPLVVGLLLFLVSGGTRPATPKARLLLVDQDQTLVSQLLASALTSSQASAVLDVERLSLEDARRRVDAGEASAMLVVPAGFAAGVLEEAPVELQLVTNPAQRILPLIVQEGVEVLVELVFYAQRLFGPVLRQLGSAPAEGFANPQISALAVEVNERMRALGGIVLPPVLTLVEERAEAEAGASEASRAATPDFGLVFVPGLLLMSVLFIAQGSSGDVWEEKRVGTLRRARALPSPPWQWLAGKLLASSLLVAAVAVVALMVVWLLFGVQARRLPLALAWTWIAGVALLCYFTLLQVAASSERGAQLLGTLVVFPLIMIGGSFFPFEAMPSWMAAIGRWTPNGLAVVRLREILDGRAEVTSLLMSAVAIGVPAAVALLVTSRRLAGRFPVS